MNDQGYDILQDMLDLYDDNTCRHENTERGGYLWTICCDCDMKWADDRGGFVPYQDPKCVAEARVFLERENCMRILKVDDGISEKRDRQLNVDKLVHVGGGIIMSDRRFIVDVSARMATFVAEPIADEIVKRYNAYSERKPVAWTWSQLMHDSMGGWEQKIERSPPGEWVRKEDILNLKPLFGE